MPSSLPLLDFGADPAVCNDQGQAPLAGAPYKGDAAMVSLLLERGTDVEGAMPGGRTALMIAAMWWISCYAGVPGRTHAMPAASALDVARITGAADKPQQIAAALEALPS